MKTLAFTVVFATICGLVIAELPYQEFLNRRIRNPDKLREIRSHWRDKHQHGSSYRGVFGNSGRFRQYHIEPGTETTRESPLFSTVHRSHRHSCWGHSHGSSDWRFSNRPPFGLRQGSHHRFHYPHYPYPHYEFNHGFPKFGSFPDPSPFNQLPDLGPTTQLPQSRPNNQFPNIEYHSETTSSKPDTESPIDKRLPPPHHCHHFGPYYPFPNYEPRNPLDHNEPPHRHPYHGSNCQFSNFGANSAPSTLKPSTEAPYSKPLPQSPSPPQIPNITEYPYDTTQQVTIDQNPGDTSKDKNKSNGTNGIGEHKPTESNNLTTPNPETSTSKSSTVSQMSVEECVKSCPATIGYNPICGTNNVTYQNIEMFLCAKKCGLAIEVRGESECPTKETTISTTEESLPETTKKPSIKKTMAFQLCMNSCVYSPDFKPVCGTDLDTYYNHDRLQCAKKCGEDVEVLCEFACYTSHCSEHFITTSSTTPTTLTTITTPTAKTILPTITTPKTKPTPTETATAAALTTSTTPIGPCPSCVNMEETTQKTNLQQCLQNICPVTSDYNPVCGTNGVTYDNPGKLLCAQLCGVDVTFKQFSRCSVIEAVKANLTALPTTESPESITVTCLKACPVTSEYNPVCGTNNVTYSNLAKLECLRMCGAVDVELSYHSACSGDQKDLDKTSTSTTTASGSAAASTSTSRSDTTSTTTSRITVITPTTSNPSTDNIPDTEPEMQTTPKGFTIDQNILDTVFGIKRTTTEGTPTTTEEDFFIDPRFNSV